MNQNRRVLQLIRDDQLGLDSIPQWIVPHPRLLSESQVKLYLVPFVDGIQTRNQFVRLALRHFHRLQALSERQKRQRAAIVLTRSLRDHRWRKRQKRQRAAIVLTRSLRDHRWRKRQRAVIVLTRSLRDYYLSVVYKERMKIREGLKLQEYAIAVVPKIPISIEFGWCILA